MRPKEEEKTTDNRTVLNRLRRRLLNCSFCKPHRAENAGRQERPDKHKNHRRMV